MKKKLFLGVLLVILVWFVAQKEENIGLDIYGHLWWFDLTLHFLGGLLISVFTILFLRFRYKTPLRKTFTLAMSMTLIIGVLWEIAQFLDPTHHASTSDTLTDIIADMAGATFGTALILTTLSKRKTRA